MNSVKLRVAMLMACGLMSSCSHKIEPDKTDFQKTICFIPLDDRPVNYDRAVWLSKSMGFNLMIPDKEMVGTRLDNMTPFPNYRTCGDREGLFMWLKACEGKCKYYVISVDQLLSGGLVSSRWLANTDLCFENEICDYLIELSHKYRVVIFDSIMRLASTVNYGGYTIDEYYKFREYTKQARRIIPDAELNIESIISNYTIGVDGRILDSKGLTDGQLARYFASRRRKLQLTDRLLRCAGNLDFYAIGVDDSSPGNTIQSNEIRYLSSFLKENASIASGIDEMGLIGLARVAAAKYGGVKASVEYFGGKQQEYADPYDYLPLTQVVENKFKYLGLESAYDSNCLNVLILTRSDDYVGARKSLLSKANDLIDAGKSVCIIDPNSNFEARDQKTELGKELLLGNISLLELMGYSSWNTASNAVGVGLSNAVGRYAYLQSGSPSAESNLNFIKAMGFSYLKDISYKSCGFSEQQKESMELFSFNYVLGKLNASEIVVNPKTFRTEPHKSVHVSNFSKPWNRDFELLFDLTY